MPSFLPCGASFVFGVLHAGRRAAEQCHDLVFAHAWRNARKGVWGGGAATHQAEDQAHEGYAGETICAGWSI